MPEAALGIFLRTIFHAWVRLDIGTIKIPLFDHAFAAWCELSVPAKVIRLFLLMLNPIC